MTVRPVGTAFREDSCKDLYGFELLKKIHIERDNNL